MSISVFRECELSFDDTHEDDANASLFFYPNYLTVFWSTQTNKAIMNDLKLN